MAPSLIPPLARYVLLGCSVVIPFAAFSAAYAYRRENGKKINIISAIIGVIAIFIMGVVIYHYP